NVNSDSGMLNTVSGKEEQSVQVEPGNGVHVEPESVFMIGRNMQLVMRKERLAYWKKISGYHRRSLADKEQTIHS
ncbi:hypothetical protein, partial [Aeromonas veronii]|uniref:hypothetical protein n=1 Tax=Aeromonas veronii TaxID=654 RepID=UPI003D1F61B9